MVEGREFWKTQSELVSQTWLSPSTKNVGLHQCKCLKLWKINTTTIYQTESLTIIKIENMNEKSNFSLLKNENWKFDKKKFWLNCFLFLFFFQDKNLWDQFLSSHIICLVFMELQFLLTVITIMLSGMLNNFDCYLFAFSLISSLY